MKLREIASILDAREAVVEAMVPDVEVSGVRFSDQLSDVLSFARPGEFLLTGLIHRQVVRTAEMAELSGICVVGGGRPDDQAIELARKISMPLLISSCSCCEARERLSAHGLALAAGADPANE